MSGEGVGWFLAEAWAVLDVSKKLDTIIQLLKPNTCQDLFWHLSHGMLQTGSRTVPRQCYKTGDTVGAILLYSLSPSISTLCVLGRSVQQLDVLNVPDVLSSTLL